MPPLAMLSALVRLRGNANDHRELHILFLLRPYLEKSLKGAKLAQGLLLGNANDHRELCTLFLCRP